VSGGGTAEGGESLHHDQLPLPDYDHLPLGSLEGRIRSLDADGLTALLDYERAHGDRLPVTQLLERRLEAVRGGAELSGGSPLAATPELQHAPAATGAAQVEAPLSAPDKEGAPGPQGGSGTRTGAVGPDH
jgi:hypothetical protein